MLVKGAPGVFDIVLFQVMTDGLMCTKPLLTCNDIHRAPSGEGITYYPRRNGRAWGADSVSFCGFLQTIEA